MNGNPLNIGVRVPLESTLADVLEDSEPVSALGSPTIKRQFWDEFADDAANSQEDRSLVRIAVELHDAAEAGMPSDVSGNALALLGSASQLADRYGFNVLRAVYMKPMGRSAIDALDGSEDYGALVSHVVYLAAKITHGDNDEPRIVELLDSLIRYTVTIWNMVNATADDTGGAAAAQSA